MKTMTHSADRMDGHYRRACAFLFLALSITGCMETVTDTSIDIPYVEEIIVQGYLNRGPHADTIWVMRTLPPLGEWTIERAAITDAEAVITVDEARHTLRSLGNGGYVFDGVTKEVGMSFDLRVTVGSKVMTATATIPASTPIESISIDTVVNGCTDGFPPTVRGDQMRLSAGVLVAPNTVYSTSFETAISFASIDTTMRQPGRSRYFYRPEYVGEVYQRVMDRECLDDELPFTIDTIFVRLFTYETSYTRFHQTRRDDDADLLFGPGVDDIEWNVKGDGFGTFFGRAVAYDTLVIDRG